MATLATEHAAVEKRCGAAGGAMVKELREAAGAKAAADRDQTRAEGKFRAHVERMVAAQEMAQVEGAAVGIWISGGALRTGPCLGWGFGEPPMD